nr:GH25 family lysozyme [Stakelama sediminis]
MLFAAWRYGTHWRPDPKRYPTQGIDVSAANGAVNWPLVHLHGVDFAYIRATDGATTRDAKFADNWAAAKAAGIPRGAEHVFSLCSSADDQAANFVQTVPREADALPSALRLAFEPDCSERPPRDAVVKRVATFLRFAEHHMGKPMLIDISPAFEKQYRISEDIARPVWSERNFRAPDYAARPWKIWRANAYRNIDGVPTSVDWDVIAP